MNTEERLSVIEKRLTMIEDEIEKIQKDLNILGENTKFEIPCFSVFENSLTKKILKEKNDETGNASTSISA